MKTGLGIVDVLLVVFVVLKLCGAVSWGWATVLAPLWFILGEVFGAICIELNVAKKIDDECEKDDSKVL